MHVARSGLAMAKPSFQVHGVDAHGKVVIRKPLSRSKGLPYFAQLPACRIGPEACRGAHYGARELQKVGPDVRLRAVQYLRPYRTNQKNDPNEAEAICEAVSRPRLRCGPMTATASVATIGDGHAFQHGRQFAAWLGWVPKQPSTGGKLVLGRITKHGNVYWRTWLIHGARAVLQFSAPRTAQKRRCVEQVRHRRGRKIAAVALAAKHARMAPECTPDHQGQSTHAHPQAA